ncbi:MAG: winged-helix domain-containing protein [Actinomycetota bacterium]|nr:MAG: redox-sensing transcriptional [Actinomycetota bacterium]MDO8950833.1 winged-helix domain-containing protein [Actinomycetota bacterium]MDP3629911.1 winged-helix domain-containing protein [Actinomycetota bacterium]
MSDGRSAPDATLYRLSLYHCYLGELLRVGAPGRITSRQLADELGAKEETVRRDISFVGDIGRPGAGYEPEVLFGAVTEFLGLSDEYPIAMIGTARMLEALQVVFPCERYGMKPTRLFSELPEDAGQVIGGLAVQNLPDIAQIDPGAGISVALVACSPGWVQVSLDLLAAAGVAGALLLTPIIRVRKPAGMEITQLRMPCDLKSLACKCRAPIGAVGSR